MIMKEEILAFFEKELILNATQVGSAVVFPSNFLFSPRCFACYKGKPSFRHYMDSLKKNKYVYVNRYAVRGFGGIHLYLAFKKL